MVQPGAEQGADSQESEALARALRDDVRAVLRVLEGSSVEAVRLERDGRRLVLRRSWETVEVEAGAGVEAPAQPPPVAEDLSRLALPGRHEVRSQVVGVFHRTRRADGPVLANEGDVVENGQVLGVVETLGIAGDVTAPVRGRLDTFTAEDGQPVEYGEVLAIIQE